MDINIIIIFLRNIPTWAVILPTILCSIILLAVAIERLLFFRKIDLDYSSLIMKDELVLNPITEIIINSRQHIGKTSGGYINIIFLYSEKAIRQIEKYIGVVSTIATIAPMIGLLGTVTGFMKSFHALATEKGASGMLAAGITEALVTTAIGLFVAIPAIIFHNYLVSKSTYFIKEVEYVANYLSEENK